MTSSITPITAASDGASTARGNHPSVGVAVVRPTRPMH
jgi:hypothetical protein